MNRQQTRCWETGVQLPLSRAFGLDIVAALREYERLAAKTHVLHDLVEELAPPAGNGERAQELDLPPYVRRVVSEAMAEAHVAAVGLEGLFRPLPELVAERRARWLQRAVRVQGIGERVDKMVEEEKKRFSNTAAGFRKRFPAPVRNKAAAVFLDAHLALRYLDAGAASIEAWLAEIDIEEIIAGLPVSDELGSAFVAEVRRAREKVDPEDEGTEDGEESAA